MKNINDLHQKKDKNKKKNFLYDHFKRYIVDYAFEGNHIRIFSNVGTSRLIKNTKANQKKLNRIIVENKIAISKKIDEYGKNSNERLLVILINMFFLVCSGMLVPLTFFIGNFYLFLLSIILFSFATLATSVILFNYYILLKEIRNLKELTGYKKDLELSLLDFKMR